MNTNVQKAIPLVEQFKNELTERLNIIDDLSQVRVATYKEFQERYDTWHCDEIEEAYANWRERQDKSLAKKIAETGNEYAIKGYGWNVSLPNYNKFVQKVILLMNWVMNVSRNSEIVSNSVTSCSPSNGVI